MSNEIISEKDVTLFVLEHVCNDRPDSGYRADVIGSDQHILWIGSIESNCSVCHERLPRTVDEAREMAKERD